MKSQCVQLTIPLTLDGDPHSLFCYSAHELGNTANMKGILQDIPVYINILVYRNKHVKNTDTS